MELLLILLFLVVIAAIAGVIAGLLGVGGGIVLVPSFYFLFISLGYDTPKLMQICVATSLATIIVTSVRSVMSHHKRGKVDWEILRAWAPWIMLGAISGVILANQLRSATLLGVFGVIGIVIGLYMAFGRQSWRLGDEMPQGVLRRGIGSAIGLLSVLMGIGGGSFAVPLMTLYGKDIHRAVATAAGFGVIIAAPSVLTFLFFSVPEAGRPPFMLGQVNLAAFAIIVSVASFTAPLGASLAHRLDPKPLKRIFAIFICIIALNMIRKAMGL